MKSINRRMVTGIAWMSLMRIAIKGLGLVSTVILARLLAPADFGVVAMAMSIISGLELLRDFSFDVALIQRQDADRSHYDTAWTFNVIFGLTLAIVLCALSLPAAGFYNEPRLANVILVLAAGVLVGSFENIGVVAFRKELEFRKEFMLRTAQKACSLVVTLPLAFLLRSYWALVIGMVCNFALSVALSYYAHPFRPRFSFAARAQLFSFSKWLFATNLLWFLQTRTPDFVLGRISGPSALGVFSVSFEISNLATTELVAPINRAVLPGYAKMAHDLQVLRQGFLNVIGLIVLLGLPVGFGIAAVAKPIVDIFLGAQWSSAVPLVSILAIFGALNSLQTNCGVVHWATGHPHTLALIGFIQVILLLPAMIWATLAYGPIGMAWVYLANVVLVIVPLNYGFALHRLRLPLSRVWSVVWRPAIATCVMYLTTTAWVRQTPESSIGSLVVAVAFGAATYASILILLWLASGRPEGAEATATRKFLSAWQRTVDRSASGQ
jgi:lipopolysaccharide exporter